MIKTTCVTLNHGPITRDELVALGIETPDPSRTDAA